MTKNFVRKELPLEQAVQEAAEQNWNVDLAKGLVHEEDKPEEFADYLEEARHLLETTGENYLPESTVFHHIVLKK